MSFFFAGGGGCHSGAISRHKISEGKAASTAKLHRSGTTIITIKALRPYIYRGLPCNKILFTIPHDDRDGYRAAQQIGCTGEKKYIYIIYVIIHTHCI